MDGWAGKDARCTERYMGCLIEHLLAKLLNLYISVVLVGDRKGMVVQLPSVRILVFMGLALSRTRVHVMQVIMDYFVIESALLTSGVLTADMTVSAGMEPNVIHTQVSVPALLVGRVSSVSSHVTKVSMVINVSRNVIV